MSLLLAVGAGGAPGVPVLAYPPGYLGLPPAGATPREAARVINSLVAGKLNAMIEVTLAENTTTSVITDARIGPGSFFWFTPLTANAAAELGGGTMYVSSRGKQTATITHASAASTDRTFVALILG